MYVWFDALTNYLSGVQALTKKDGLDRYWPATAHIIGKDIIWHHTAMWGSILTSAGLPLPESVLVLLKRVDNFSRESQTSCISRSIRRFARTGWEIGLRIPTGTRFHQRSGRTEDVQVVQQRREPARRTRSGNIFLAVAVAHDQLDCAL